jgi:hypothetical protein
LKRKWWHSDVLSQNKGTIAWLTKTEDEKYHDTLISDKIGTGGAKTDTVHQRRSPCHCEDYQFQKGLVATTQYGIDADNLPK